MLGILIILLISVYLAFIFPANKPDKKEETSERYANQMKKLWGIAQDSMKDRKPLRAEKALLTILKFDEKNAAAYNRLGIIYAKSQKYNEAIECFEIAQSLDESVSSLYNVGLIYYETQAYEKAAMAFRRAIKLEGDAPIRYISLAKAEEKLGNRKNAIEALETAYDLDQSVATLRQILAIHEDMDNQEAIAATSARIEQRLAENFKRRESDIRRQHRYNRNVKIVPHGSTTGIRQRMPNTTVKSQSRTATKPISTARPKTKKQI